MTANPIDLVGGLTTTANVAKADITGWAKARVPQVFADATEVRNTTLALQLVVFIKALGQNWFLDTTDTTTADDGINCIISADGKRFKPAIATVAFKQNGAGAVVRTLQSKAQEIVSVLDYGAVADGVTDNAPFINAAILAAFTASTTGGGTVYVPQAAKAYRIASPIVLLKGISIVGDFGLSSQIFADDCDAIHLSVTFQVFGQQTVSGLYLNGGNSTAIRNAVFFAGDLSNNDIIAGIVFRDMYISNFDTAFRISGIQNAVIQNIWAQYINQGCVFTGVVYNTDIVNCNFYSIAGLNPPTFGGTAFAGLSLYTKNYTTTGGVLPPEGIFLDNANFFGFNIGIDADACDTLQVHHASIVALVYGFRFNNVTTVNNFTDSSIEMHGSGALAGIYGVPLAASNNAHRTILMNNTIQGSGGATATTACYGIVINGPGGQYQDDVIVQNNSCKNLNVYDIYFTNPGGNSRIINNKCNSTSGSGSMAITTPVSPSTLLVAGNTCAMTIDYSSSATDWPAGTIRSENNTISAGTPEKSSWNLTSPVARFMTFAGPTAARIYTLPDTTDTITTLAAVQALTNKTFNGNTWTAGTGTLTLSAGKTLTVNNTLTFTGTDGSSIALGAGGTVLYSGGALGTPASGIATNLTGTASGLTAGNATLAASATKLATARTIGIGGTTGLTATGINFDGTAAIAPALTGTLAVANGGTGDTGTGWTAYSPTPTAATPGTSVLTLNSARWKQLAGKTVILEGDITVTTAGTGSGVISMPLPFTAAAFRFVGSGQEEGLTARMEVATINASATSLIVNDFSGTPLAFANGARHVFTIIYETV